MNSFDSLEEHTDKKLHKSEELGLPSPKGRQGKNLPSTQEQNRKNIRVLSVHIALFRRRLHTYKFLASSHTKFFPIDMLISFLNEKW